MLSFAPIRSLDAFDDLRGLWESLIPHCPEATVFHTFSWQRAWLEHLGGRGRLLTLLAHEGGEAVGILPLVVRRAYGLPFRRLQWAGTGVSDYLGPLVIPERARDVFLLAAEWLSANAAEYDVADLQGLPEGCGALEAARQAGSGSPTGREWHARGLRWRVAPQAVCPYVALPATWDAFAGGLSRRVRYNLGYYLRLLRRDFPVAIDRVPTADVDREMGVFFDLHARRWRRRLMPGVLGDRRVQAFHRAAAQSLQREDRLRLFRLRLDGETVASLYCFALNGRAFYYLGGFDPSLGRYSVGSVLTGYAIRSALEEGCREFDFLRGREEYKYRWRCLERWNWRAVAEKPASVSRLAAQTIEVEQRLAERYEAWAHSDGPATPPKTARRNAARPETAALGGPNEDQRL